MNDLLDRLDDKLRHFPPDAVSAHVVFEENGSHRLYRTSVTCHVPGHTVATHEENRDPGVAIRETFAEIERRLEKQKALVRHEPLVRRSRRARQISRAGAASAPSSEGAPAEGGPE